MSSGVNLIERQQLRRSASIRPLAFIQKSLLHEGKGEGEKGKVSFPFAFSLCPFPYFCKKSIVGLGCDRLSRCGCFVSLTQASVLPQGDRISVKSGTIEGKANRTPGVLTPLISTPCPLVKVSRKSDRSHPLYL